MKANDLRPGMAAIIDGKLCICSKAAHVTPGNLRAFVQAKFKRIPDGTSVEKRLRSTEEVERAILDRREMEYLYSDNTGHILMDKQTFDQVTVSNELIGDSIKFFTPNTTLTTQVYQGNVVAIELPEAVDLKVVDTLSAIKGATVTNQLKDAVLETGLRTRVPPFITTGELVRISTRDGSYIERAK